LIKKDIPNIEVVMMVNLLKKMELTKIETIISLLKWILVESLK